MPDPVYGTPVLLTDNHTVSDWALPLQNEPLVFNLKNVGKPFDAKLVPFYKTYNQYYNVYWDYFTKEGWVARQAEYEAEKKRAQVIEERTIDIMRLGEMQPERDHHLEASENSFTSDALGRMGREARRGGFFSFDIKVNPAVPNSLFCTFLGDDKNRAFDILIDSVKLVSVEWSGGQTGKFYDKEYPLPADMIKDKSKVTVTIAAVTAKTAGRIFGCRTIKSSE
jgi:hypothetical protein